MHSIRLHHLKPSLQRMPEDSLQCLKYEPLRVDLINPHLEGLSLLPGKELSKAVLHEKLLLFYAVGYLSLYLANILASRLDSSESDSYLSPIRRLFHLNEELFNLHGSYDPLHLICFLYLHVLLDSLKSLSLLHSLHHNP